MNIPPLVRLDHALQQSGAWARICQQDREEERSGTPDGKRRLSMLKDCLDTLEAAIDEARKAL